MKDHHNNQVKPDNINENYKLNTYHGYLVTVAYLLTPSVLCAAWPDCWEL
jgi:hypothetical protein